MKLPNEIKINLWEILRKENRVDEFWDIIGDYLSNEYGCDYYGYGLNDNIELVITEIEWDEK